MRTFLFITIMLLSALSARAHNPQLSTITLVQSKDHQWSLVVGSSLLALQYELANRYPAQKIDRLDAAAFQTLLVRHLKETIRIQANSGETAVLKNGAVILGHQTDVRFEVTGMPTNLESLDIRHAGFATLRNHYCLLKVITPKISSRNFILQSDNQYTARLAMRSNSLVEQPKEGGVNWWLSSLLACSIGFMVLYTVYSRRP